eukprot:359985-Chlamydomonas_euryale.AAC.4
MSSSRDGNRARARFVPRLVANRPGETHMGYGQFEQAYDLIQDQLVKQTMVKNGFTKANLIFLLLYAIFLLMLIFVFIFVGIAAFTGGGTLGAIINSLLAAGSGIALNLKKEDKEKEAETSVAVKIGDEEYVGGGSKDEEPVIAQTDE